MGANHYLGPFPREQLASRLHSAHETRKGAKEGLTQLRRWRLWPSGSPENHTCLDHHSHGLGHGGPEGQVKGKDHRLTATHWRSRQAVGRCSPC